MSANPPPLPKAENTESILQRRYALLNPWSDMPFANTATRREAKAILFKELAVAVKHGMPLDEALNNAMQSEGSRLDKLFNRKPGNILTAWALVIFYLFLVGTGAIFLLLLLSTWASDVERVARVFAIRLSPLVRQGYSLADAMRQLPADYTEEEAETIRAGEAWGDLAGALENLSSFQYYEREIQRHWSRMAYPIWLSFLALGIIQFTVIFIVPKFRDIYDQLGAELPAPTQFLIGIGGFLFNTAGYILIPVLGFIFWVLVLRMFMVGNRFLRNLAITLVVVASGWIGFMAVAAATENSVSVESTIAIIIVAILAVMLLVSLSVYFLKFLERIIIAIEDWTGGIFGYLPIVGAPRQTEREARWLGAVATGLNSGVLPADAVEAAGNICRGRIKRRSADAAAQIRQGHSLGDSIVQHGVLRDRYAHRLRLLEGRRDYLQGMVDIAEDASRDSYHMLNRASRLAEVGSVVLIGLISALFAVAMYLPLFNIPQIVGLDY